MKMFESHIYPKDDLRIDDDGLSEIQQFYKDATVFITGATGFLGKLLLEKLLRRCRGIKRIYILVRSKKQNYVERLDKMFEECIFEDIRINYKDVLAKVHVICGDLSLPNLGLNEEDREVLKREVNFIFHLAATVRFDEDLKTATYINVRATWDLLKLALKVANLRVFVHVSTAFTFPARHHIDEEKYEIEINAESLINLVNTTEDAKLQEITPSILGKWPNTYTFTKAIAEDLLFRKAEGLLYAIVRPSIVISTAKEPISGWTDNFGGITGLYIGIELGLVHVIEANYKKVLEVVPADYVVNNIVAVAWYTEVNKNKTNNIYNYVSSPQKPIYCDVANGLLSKSVDNIPTIHQFWHKFTIYASNKYMLIVLHYILHVSMGYIIDFLNLLQGQKPFAVKKYRQASSRLEVINYFVRGEWTFGNNNTQLLWKGMSLKDRQLFNFDMESHNWEEYAATYGHGLRVYLLKDPMDTVPQAKKRQMKLKVAHYTITLILLFIICSVSFCLLNIFCYKLLS
ncbi:hypothetical protein RI129_013264 [Pyrocoelia pectoralis]|uniref:Fatty acyl-CoA reductase n=1 Tax=Pyrocoelia pectoralis TaxID=417401 RepID=A0AAN7V7W4_9COLE